MYHFGSGALYAVPSWSGANPTPMEFGLLQDVTLDFSFSNKELYGRSSMPSVLYRGKGKVTAKAKTANIKMQQLLFIFFGIQAMSSGANQIILGEVGSAVANTYTAVHTGGGVYGDDLGVVNQATGINYLKVASAPSAGQYSVTSAGVYTFAGGDTGPFIFSYTYTVAGAGAGGNLTPQSIVYPNFPMGQTPNFIAQFYTQNPNTSDQLGVKFFNGVTSKLTLATKTEDFTIPEFDMEFSADAAGNFATIIGSH